MPACSFCKKNYENPRGLTIFTFDGKSIFYCSSKCRNNAKLGRDPKKTGWVKSVKKIKVKEVVSEKPKKEEKKVEVKEEKVEEKKTEAKKEKVEEKKEVKEKVE
jgi:large subunit ribosomal protein L24e